MPLAITYGYSREHREDLKQWILALATTHDGDIPIFLRPLDGNSSDKEHLSASVKAVLPQLSTITQLFGHCLCLFSRPYPKFVP